MYVQLYSRIFLKQIINCEAYVSFQLKVHTMDLIGILEHLFDKLKVDPTKHKVQKNFIRITLHLWVTARHQCFLLWAIFKLSLRLGRRSLELHSGTVLGRLLSFVNLETRRKLGRVSFCKELWDCY